MIDRYLLRYFLAVVDEGNFTRAAARCRVSQPTLSVGIAKLEGLVGKPLFDRTNRRVALTTAGARFVQHARRIEAEFAAAERSAREETQQRVTRIGVISTLPSAWIGNALASAHAATHSGSLEIIEGRGRDLRAQLQRGGLDAALCDLEDEGKGNALFAEGYALALPATHRLADRHSIGAEELGGEPMIVRRNCEALADTSRFFTARGIRPFMAARTVNDDRAVAYVRAGLGITVVPRCFTTDGIVVVSLSGFGLRRTIGTIADPGAEQHLRSDAPYQAFIAAIADAGQASVIA
jgi:DNA-binding transcriptional LysR family regulator